ncbi:MAG: protein translocase subunit SecF, partial [Proteobacteria bacterium]|nr:protein translocase subunit SecF [Pseudomonadota bacterium]
TSVTTLLALGFSAVFGGAVLRDFALAMIWGVVIGTYSSIFVAVGFLSRFDIRHQEPDDGVEVPETERS